MKSCTIRHSIQLLFLACPALLNAQQALPDVSVKANTTSATPVGAVDYPAEITDVRPIAKDQPAYALPQVLEGQPGDWLGFAAGAMLFVISHEIIPETHRNGFESWASVTLLAGFVFMLMLDAAFA